jgi:hypothetical protein
MNREKLSASPSTFQNFLPPTPGSGREYPVPIMSMKTRSVTSSRVDGLGSSPGGTGLGDRGSGARIRTGAKDPMCR